ncbi:Platelet glycoprotein VI [Microtus ochrogaster]|uniref:Platelet glycoprotein VI n=1 Tax=Microtus ochrogaster TaxID=79684 RepID=A0A8J6GCW3_MICOH|nr:Platelet glycoprotein VI [Microtus ochrogaster]
MQAQSGPFPKPSLWAEPSSLVALEQSVTLRCQGPPVVDLYRLEKLKSQKYEDQNFLFIKSMQISHAGRYRCSYQNGSRWSPPSDHLELIATGVYGKPSLSAYPSSAVPPGRDVTLQCQTKYGFDQFALRKDQDTGLYKTHERWYQANFSIIKVTAAHSGIYRCYSFSSSSPYLWSAPSDPLVLVVTGPSATPSQVPTEVPSPTTGFSHQHYGNGNLVRICLGAMIIIFLVGLLAEDWHSRKKRPPPRIRAVQRPLPLLPLA